MTTMETLIIAFVFGTALTLLIVAAIRIGTAVEREDRSYLDRPPPALRMLWPVVRLVVHYLGASLPMTWRVRTHARLRKAGQDYSLSPEQFFAAKLLSAVVAGLMALSVATAIGKGAGFVAIAAALFWFYPDLWLREATERRHKQLFRALPFYLDIVTLSVEAGTNLTGALTQAAVKAPPSPLRNEVNRILRDIRAGKPRAEALRAFAERVDMPAINLLVASLVQAENMGATLGPILRAQADQRRTERFQRAEKLAMEAPVKLLAPLVMFIFPNFFIVLTFMLISKAVTEGVLNWGPLVWALTWPAR
jgi:tight adherence protein C